MAISKVLRRIGKFNKEKRVAKEEAEIRELQLSAMEKFPDLIADIQVICEQVRMSRDHDECHRRLLFLIYTLSGAAKVVKRCRSDLYEEFQEERNVLAAVMSWECASRFINDGKSRPDKRFPEFITGTFKPKGSLPGVEVKKEPKSKTKVKHVQENA